MENRIRYCHNKQCEAFNIAQGDCGCEDLNTWDCIICHKKLTKKNDKLKEVVK